MSSIKDRMVYVVIVAHESGDFIPEQPVSVDRKIVVRDIANGQYEELVQVLECNPVEHICDDKTEDIAWAVSAIWADIGEPLSVWQRDFIEQTIGFAAANAFPRAA
jgi:hypothetical protein